MDPRPIMLKWGILLSHLSKCHNFWTTIHCDVIYKCSLIFIALTWTNIVSSIHRVLTFPSFLRLGRRWYILTKSWVLYFVRRLYILTSSCVLFTIHIISYYDTDLIAIYYYWPNLVQKIRQMFFLSWILWFENDLDCELLCILFRFFQWLWINQMFDWEIEWTVRLQECWFETESCSGHLYRTLAAWEVVFTFNKF